MIHKNTIHQIQDLERDGAPDVSASFYLKIRSSHKMLTFVKSGWQIHRFLFCRISLKFKYLIIKA